MTRWQRFREWLYSTTCAYYGCKGRVRIVDGGPWSLSSRREYIYCDACLVRLGVGRWRDDP